MHKDSIFTDLSSLSAVNGRLGVQKVIFATY